VRILVGAPLAIAVITVTNHALGPSKSSWDGAFVEAIALSAVYLGGTVVMERWLLRRRR
jgi:hypothetical protein